ncbi:unnamed protein product [Adineta steineri]|uniref:WAP domain-containing protein n=1 Tax=Adineta steineri TaxID=433720 RepID=A0A818VFV3_9BILA|nr:unnamed protein product [Adineta steineri]CAF3708253.1 unnamed protein product [Adineta steineri]
MVLLKFIFITFIVFLVTPLNARCPHKPDNPCKNGGTALAGYFCGRGASHVDCPSTYDCIIAPDDTYAVCCLRAQSSEKPGSCPKPSDGIGTCIAKCTYDSDCPDAQKCCGNCPRDCVQPV